MPPQTGPSAILGIDISNFVQGIAAANAAATHLGNANINPTGFIKAVKIMNTATGDLILRLEALDVKMQKITTSLSFNKAGALTGASPIRVIQDQANEIKKVNALFAEQQMLRGKLVNYRGAGAVKEGPLAEAYKKEAETIRARLVDIKSQVAQYDALILQRSRFNVDNSALADRSFSRELAIKMANAKATVASELETKQIKEVNTLYAARMDLFRRIETSKARMSTVGPNEKKVLKEDITQYQNSMANFDKQIGGYKQNIIDSSDAAEKLTEEEEAHRQAALQTAQAYDQQVAKIDQMTRRVSAIVLMLGARVMYQGLKDAIEYASSYHNLLNEIQVVTLKTKDETDALGIQFRKMANELMTPSSEIAGSAVEWYRQGLSDEQVKQRLTEATKLARVAAISIEESTTLITTAINSGMVDTAERATDVLVKLGDAAATDAEEIGQAMQRSAASANAAGVSYEWLATYITIVSERTRLSAEVIGTAMRSIFSRLHQIRSTGFNDEDATTANQIEKAFSDVNKEIGTTLTLFEKDRVTWRQLPEVFLDLADSWDLMNNKQKSYIVTQLAGVRMQDRTLALLQGLSEEFDDTTRGLYLYELAMGSAGATQEKFDIALTSVDAAQKNLRASLEELYTAIVNGDTIKDFYETLAKIVDSFSIGISAVGGFNFELLATIAGGIALVSVIYQISKAVLGVAAALKTTNIALGIFTAVGGGFAAILVGVAALAAGFVYLNGKAKQAADPIKTLGEETSRFVDAQIKWNSTISELDSFIDAMKNVKGSTLEAAEKQEIYNKLMETLVSKSPALAGLLKDTSGAWLDVESAISAVNTKMEEYIALRDAEALRNAQRVVEAFPTAIKEPLTKANSYSLAIEYLKALKDWNETAEPTASGVKTGIGPFGATADIDEKAMKKTNLESMRTGARPGMRRLAEVLGYADFDKIDDGIGFMALEKFESWVLPQIESVMNIADTMLGLSQGEVASKIDEYASGTKTIIMNSLDSIGLSKFGEEMLSSYVDELATGLKATDFTGMPVDIVAGKFSEMFTNARTYAEGITKVEPIKFAQYIAEQWTKNNPELAKTMVDNGKYLSVNLISSFGDAILDAQKNLEKYLPDDASNIFWDDFIASFVGGGDIDNLTGILKATEVPFNLIQDVATTKLEELAAVFETSGDKIKASQERILSFEPDATGDNFAMLQDLYRLLDTDMSVHQFESLNAALVDTDKTSKELHNSIRGLLSVAESIPENDFDAPAKEILTLVGAYQKLQKEFVSPARLIDFGRSMIGKLSGATTTEELIEAAKVVRTYMDKVPENYVDPFVKMMPNFLHVITGIESGSIKLENLNDNTSQYTQKMASMELEILESSGRALGGVAKIFDSASFDTTFNKARSEINALANSSIPNLSNALSALALINSGAVMSTEELEEAYGNIGKAINMSAEDVKNNPVRAYQELDYRASTLNTTLKSLATMVLKANPDAFNNLSNWRDVLREMADGGDLAAYAMITFVDSMESVDGVVLGIGKSSNNTITFFRDVTASVKTFDEVYSEFLKNTTLMNAQKLAVSTYNSLVGAKDEESLKKEAARIEDLFMKMSPSERTAAFEEMPKIGVWLKQIREGVITTKNLNEATKDLALTVKTMQVEGWETSKVHLEGVADVMKDYAENGIASASDKMEELAGNSLPKLYEALYLANGIQSETIKGTERLGDAFETIASQVNMTAEQVEKLPTTAFGKLEEEALKVANTMSFAANSMSESNKKIFAQDNWRESLKNLADTGDIYAMIANESITAIESVEGVHVRVVENAQGYINFVTDFTVTLEALKESYAEFRDSQFTEEDTLALGANVMGMLKGAVDDSSLKDAAGQVSALFNELDKAPRDAFVAMFPDFDKFIDRAQKGEMSMADFNKEAKKYTDVIARKQLKAYETNGRSLAGLSDIMEDFAKGNTQLANKNLTLLATNTMPKLMKALNQMTRLQDGSIKTAEEQAQAWADVGAAIGMSGEDAMADPMSALALLQWQASETAFALSYLSSAMLGASGVTFTADNWEAELRRLASEGDASAAAILRLIDTARTVEGASITAVPNSMGGLDFQVNGLGAQPTKPKKSGGGGGGGGGAEEGMSEAVKNFLDQLARRKELDDFNRQIISLRKEYHELRGEITAVMTLTKQEIAYIEGMNGANEATLASLTEQIHAKQAEVLGMSTSNKLYKQATGDLEALQEQHKEYSTAVLENVNDLEELRQSLKELKRNIRDLEIGLRETLREAFEARAELEASMLDGRVAMEDLIFSIIQERYQKEWDLANENLDNQREAYDEQLRLLRDNLNKRKQIAEDAKKSEELAGLESQLEMISADPTRAKERLELQKRIATLREEISWDAAEREVEAQEESINKQIETLEEHVEYLAQYYEDLFEHPKRLIQEVEALMAMTDAQIVAWLTANSTEYLNASSNRQLQMAKEWNETLRTMHGTAITYWDEIEDLITQGDDAIIAFLKANHPDYRNAGKLQAEAYVDEWLDQLQALKDAYKDTQDYINQEDIYAPPPSSGEDQGGSTGSTGGKKRYGYKNVSGTWIESGTLAQAITAGVAHWQEHVDVGGWEGRVAYNIQNAIRAATEDNLGTHIKKYAKGGLVDYTGIAAVHGSSANPEAFLSSIDTRMIRGMLDAFKLIIPRLSSIDSSGSTEYGGFTIEAINITVEKLDNETDLDLLANKIGEKFAKQLMGKRGTSIGNLRIK